MKSKIEWVGFAAMIASCTSFFPGAYTVWINWPKPASSISLPMYVIFDLGVVLWIVYGVKKQVWAMWFTNAIIAVPAFSVLAYKLIYG